jgi:hypothetical protein
VKYLAIWAAISLGQLIGFAMGVGEPWELIHGIYWTGVTVIVCWYSNRRIPVENP